ncbi:hypothetical protein LX32DRAFT_189053 [Colletotrichum zoysiae]|uniref:Uncharacterized protein n=1 Tax=Colletotrichum zoysiae TaxID=1216348 RepID=A0AAD9HP61_9PEZI|nr:hypothetical protein LX32DRAFT_189053 [Colletotrichum zoysiae]
MPPAASLSSPPPPHRLQGRLLYYATRLVSTPERPPLPSLLPQAQLRTTLPRTQKVDVRTKKHTRPDEKRDKRRNKSQPPPPPPPVQQSHIHLMSQHRPFLPPVQSAPLPVHRQTVGSTQLQTQKRPRDMDAHTLYIHNGGKEKVLLRSSRNEPPPCPTACGNTHKGDADHQTTNPRAPASLFLASESKQNGTSSQGPSPSSPLSRFEEKKEKGKKNKRKEQRKRGNPLPVLKPRRRRAWHCWPARLLRPQL